MSIRSLGTRELDGEGTFARGWGLGSYTLYFAASFDRPVSIHRAGSGRARIEASGSAIELKVGLSFRSEAQARRNARREAPGFQFDRVRAAAEAAWARALARVGVTGGTAEERVELATALYHSELMPHDLSGENVWWRSRQPHYEDFFTLWDTFRTQQPLLRLIEPARAAAMVRSLLDTYVHTGWLPDARIAGNNGLTQGGSNADVVIADAIVGRLRGFDYRTAYRALLKDADVNSRRYIAEGRQLTEYARRGYLATDERASASRTLEYAYDDFAISEVAGALGDRNTQARLRKRSLDWTRLWDAGTRTVRPRRPNGSFINPFDPARSYSGWTDPFYEGDAYQYTTYVPHDVQGLVNRLGGDASAVAWLDAFFSRPSGGYTQANEPDLLAPYLYVHALRPDRTDAVVRTELTDAYGAGRGGLPGNDDSGALSSWYVWGAIGLYPNAGQPYYYIGSPLFTRAQIDVGGGRTFTVVAPGASAANRYVVGATLDGRSLCRAYVSDNEVARGGTLALTLAATPSGWGRCARPPSVERPR